MFSCARQKAEQGQGGRPVVAGLGDLGPSHPALSIHCRLVGVGVCRLAGDIQNRGERETETQVGWDWSTLASGVHSSPCLLSVSRGLPRF